MTCHLYARRTVIPRRLRSFEDSSLHFRLQDRGVPSKVYEEEPAGLLSITAGGCQQQHKTPDRNAASSHHVEPPSCFSGNWIENTSASIGGRVRCGSWRGATGRCPQRALIPHLPHVRTLRQFSSRRVHRPLVRDGEPAAKPRADMEHGADHGCAGRPPRRRRLDISTP